MKKIIRSPIFWIFLIGLILRVVHLETVPYGFHVDEVKVGWNGLSIVKTLMDDKNNLLPLYYNSFGDYRPTGIFYITGPFIYLIGNSIFATRLASSLMGALTIFPLYYLVKALENKRIKNNNFIAEWASFILAIMPWHITTSRGTSEVVMSVFFILWSILFLIKFIKTKQIRFALLYVFFLTTSYLLYHSVRITAPVIMTATLVYYFSAVMKSQMLSKTLGLVLFSFFLTGLISLHPSATQRFNQVSIFSDKDVVYEIERLKNEHPGNNIKNKLLKSQLIIYSKNIIFEYGKYFSTDFLIGNAPKPYRYLNPSVGLLYFPDIALFLIGLYSMLNNRKNTLILAFLLIAPLASSLTTEDSPNLHRSLLMSPFIAIAIATGIGTVTNILKRKYAGLIASLIFLISLANLSYFSLHYFSKVQNYKPFEKNYMIDNPTFRNIGYIELVEYLNNIKSDYDKIFVTNHPDSPYPWYAYFNNKDPKEFNSLSAKSNATTREYENIVFTDFQCPSDQAFDGDTKDILVIDSGECAIESKIKDELPAKIVKTITRNDESVVFYLIERK